mmetsp:Transcript_48408/g.151790  ORF Transcript_48408/g.151790 Transcript_48408/m.151790 type:complete len:99 (+) Transcript_48408:1331-1627(+)
MCYRPCSSCVKRSTLAMETCCPTFRLKLSSFEGQLVLARLHLLPKFYFFSQTRRLDARRCRSCMRLLSFDASEINGVNKLKMKVSPAQIDYWSTMKAP